MQACVHGKPFGTARCHPSTQPAQLRCVLRQQSARKVQQNDRWDALKRHSTADSGAVHRSDPKVAEAAEQDPLRQQTDAAAAAAADEQLAAVQQQIKQQQAAMPPSAGYSLVATQRLVETAMLAAVSGLAYALATTMHIEGYLGYFLPLPVILSALRGGPAAGRKTVTATFFLLLVTLGPVKAITYVFTHGLMAATLGVTWSRRMGWTAGVVLGSIARLTGYLGFMLLSCWVTRENLFSLLLTNFCSTLDQLAALVGSSGTSSPPVVMTFLACMLVVNAVFYIFFLTIVMYILTTNMGYDIGKPPRLVQKFLMRAG